MMKNSLALAFLVVLLAAPAAFAAPPPPAPAPKIVVFDERALMQLSKAGQDVQRQIAAYAKQLQGEKDATQKSLQSEEQQLQQQVAILAPDVRQKKIQAFQLKAQGAQAAMQRKANTIDYGVQVAQRTMSNALAPILQQVMKERGANLVVLKQAILMADNGGFDITMDVINRLNAKLPAIKVTPTAPPQQPQQPPQK
jgi:Skp family chaperone for outer membrane proteins